MGKIFQNIYSIWNLHHRNLYLLYHIYLHRISQYLELWSNNNNNTYLKTSISIFSLLVLTYSRINTILFDLDLGDLVITSLSKYFIINDRLSKSDRILRKDFHNMLTFPFRSQVMILRRLYNHTWMYYQFYIVVLCIGKTIWYYNERLTFELYGCINTL